MHVFAQYEAINLIIKLDKTLVAATAAVSDRSARVKCVKGLLTLKCLKTASKIVHCWSCTDVAQNWFQMKVPEPFEPVICLGCASCRPGDNVYDILTDKAMIIGNIQTEVKRMIWPCDIKLHVWVRWLGFNSTKFNQLITVGKLFRNRCLAPTSGESK